MLTFCIGGLFGVFGVFCVDGETLIRKLGKCVRMFFTGGDGTYTLGMPKGELFGVILCGRYLQSPMWSRAIRDLVSSGVVDCESFRSLFVCCKKPAAQAIIIRWNQTCLVECHDMSCTSRMQSISFDQEKRL
jgi:hypothetical protein